MTNNEQIIQNVTKTKPKVLKTKQKKFIELYLKHIGHITNACEEAKITRKTYYEWMKTEPFFTKFNETLESFNQTVQKNILEYAMGKDKEMLKYWANHKMKHMGFAEKQEIEITNNQISKEEIEDAINRLLKK